MRAAVYHGPRDVRVESVPEPVPPAADEVRLAVRAVGLCGTDVTEYVAGPRMIPLERPHPASGHVGPMVLGHEMVGTVEDAGDSVEGFEIGDLVVPGAGRWCGRCAWCLAGRTNLCQDYFTLGLNADGGLADFVNAPVAMCRRVPGGVDAPVAATAQPLAVAIHAARRLGVEPGLATVVIGAGGIGLPLLLAASSMGAAPLVAIDVDADRLRLAGDAGADLVLDAGDDDLEEAIARATDGGAALVAEASGAPGALALATRVARRGGRVAMVGLPKGPTEIDTSELTLREIELTSSVAHVCDTDLEPALDLLADPRVARLSVDRRIELDGVVADGLEPLAARELTGKVVVDVSSA